MYMCQDLCIWVTNYVYESQSTLARVHESRTMYKSHELCEWITIYIGSSIWVTNYLYESRTMCMRHDLHWLELCHTIWKSRPAPLRVWVTNCVYESRPILTCFMSYNMNASPFFPPHMSHELRIWVMNYIAWVTSHNLYKSPGPPPHLSHELCIYVTNYDGSSWVTPIEGVALPPSSFESRTMYMRHEVKWFRVMSHNMYESPCLPSDVSHERCIWVTSYAYESQSTVIWSYVTQYVWVTLSPSWCESRTVYTSHALHESRSILARVYESRTPVNHERCIWVTNCIGWRQELLHSIMLLRQCFQGFESRTIYMSHELYISVTNYVGMGYATQNVWVALPPSSFESWTMYMSHELSWLKTKANVLQHAAPAMFPGFQVTN